MHISLKLKNYIVLKKLNGLIKMAKKIVNWDQVPVGACVRITQVFMRDDGTSRPRERLLKKLNDKGNAGWIKSRDVATECQTQLHAAGSVLSGANRSLQKKLIGVGMVNLIQAKVPAPSETLPVEITAAPATPAPGMPAPGATSVSQEAWNPFKR